MHMQYMRHMHHARDYSPYPAVMTTEIDYLVCNIYTLLDANGVESIREVITLEFL